MMILFPRMFRSFALCMIRGHRVTVLDAYRKGDFSACMPYLLLRSRSRP